MKCTKRRLDGSAGRGYYNQDAKPGTPSLCRYACIVRADHTSPYPDTRSIVCGGIWRSSETARTTLMLRKT